MTVQISSQVKLSGSTNDLTKRQVNYAPGWYNTGMTSSNMYNFGVDFSAGILENKNIYLQYGGNYQPYATARGFSEGYQIENEHVNGDNSIEFDITMRLTRMVAKHTDYFIRGVSAHRIITFVDRQVMNVNGTSGDEYDEHVNYEITKHMKIEPKQNSSIFTTKTQFIYPNHEYTDSTLELTLLLTNPLEPLYTPCAVRENSKYLSCNNRWNNKERKNGNYVTIERENYNTVSHENAGHIRVRVNGTYRQSTKIGE